MEPGVIFPVGGLSSKNLDRPEACLPLHKALAVVGNKLEKERLARDGVAADHLFQLSRLFPLKEGAVEGLILHVKADVFRLGIDLLGQRGTLFHYR